MRKNIQNFTGKQEKGVWCELGPSGKLVDDFQVCFWRVSHTSTHNIGVVHKAKVTFPDKHLILGS